MLAVVVADVHVESEYQFERRHFGSTPEQLQLLAEMAAGADGGRSSNGIHSSILETGLGSAGAVLEAEMPGAGRCRPSRGDVASGAGAI
jgi:hypothetical protein